jgi:hypothetical protein
MQEVISTARSHSQDREQAQAPESVDYTNMRALMRGDELFVQALRDDSNLALDWLWLANQVMRDWQRCYSRTRALAIDPKSVE